MLARTNWLIGIEIMRDSVVVIFAKSPVPGNVKTRLMPQATAAQAASVYKRLLRHTLKQAGLVADTDIVVWLGGAGTHPFWNGYQATTIRQQPEGDLGYRMCTAIADELKRYRNVVVIGSDCLELTAQYIGQAVAKLKHGEELVIGPAKDGGYVLIGMNEYYSPLFEGIAWSTAEVLDKTLLKAAEIGLQPVLLEPLDDIDSYEQAYDAGLLS